MSRPALLIFAPVVLAACSVVVDGRLAEGEEDGGTGDAGMGVDCRREPDGVICDESDATLRRICVTGVCVLSRCGDGFVDLEGGEDCEDGNDVGGDGCEPGACVFSCTADAECDDHDPCSGPEACVDDVCTFGDPLAANGEECFLADDTRGLCLDGVCVPEGCGDGAVRDDEECDDGNLDDGDGCDADCTLTCRSDADCDDEDPCTGRESCDPDGNVCIPGDPVVCDDGDPCTDDRCVSKGDGVCEVVGMNADADGDGFSSMAELPSCGTDCDDTRDDVFPGAPELCDGVIDHNCEMGVADEALLTFRWFADCDGDGFALPGARSVESCDPPPDGPTTGCPGGVRTWTTTNPNTPDTRDCADLDVRAFPGAFAGTPRESWPTTRVTGVGGYDYNCDGVETLSNSCTTCLCLVFCPPGRPCTRCPPGGNWQTLTPPDCGRSARFEYCGDELKDGCRRDETLTQGCI